MSYRTERKGESGAPSYDELTVRVFRALYRDFDPYTVSSTHVAVPRGTLWFSGASWGRIARQISEREQEEDGAP
jgi:hypothetical protein